MADVKISENATLHALGCALSRCEDNEIDAMMEDVAKKSPKRIYGFKIEMTDPFYKPQSPKLKIKEPKKGTMKYMLPLPKAHKTKPVSKVDCMKPEVLSDTLTKPDRVDGRAYVANPRICGRVAYSLPVYTERANRKLLQLKVRMDAIECKIGGEWLRLRKQEIALRDRINRRNKQAYYTNEI